MARIDPMLPFTTPWLNGQNRPEAAVRPLAGAQCASNCRRFGSGILIRLVSSMARAKIARNLS
jgi:hypothetical protein